MFFGYGPFAICVCAIESHVSSKFRFLLESVFALGMWVHGGIACPFSPLGRVERFSAQRVEDTLGSQL